MKSINKKRNSAMRKGLRTDSKINGKGLGGILNIGRKVGSEAFSKYGPKISSKIRKYGSDMTRAIKDESMKLVSKYAPSVKRKILKDGRKYGSTIKRAIKDESKKILTRYGEEKLLNKKGERRGNNNVSGNFGLASGGCDCKRRF